MIGACQVNLKRKNSQVKKKGQIDNIGAGLT